MQMNSIRHLLKMCWRPLIQIWVADLVFTFRPNKSLCSHIGWVEKYNLSLATSESYLTYDTRLDGGRSPFQAPFEFIVLLLLSTSTKKGRSQSYLYLDSRKFLFFSNQSTLRVDWLENSCLYIFSLPLADIYQPMDILQQISQTVVY